MHARYTDASRRRISTRNVHDHVRYMLSPVGLSSVCNVRAPYSAGNFYAVWYIGHSLISWKILRRSSQGNPSVEEGGGLEARGVAKYSDFGLIEGYIWMYKLVLVSNRKSYMSF